MFLRIKVFKYILCEKVTEITVSLITSAHYNYLVNKLLQETDTYSYHTTKYHINFRDIQNDNKY